MPSDDRECAFSSRVFPKASQIKALYKLWHYQMRDFSKTHEVSNLLGDLPCPWGVAGGWAVNLFLERVTREHQDILEDRMLIWQD
jgi:aminoglycoside-2''-adenylyltransferase